MITALYARSMGLEPIASDYNKKLREVVLDGYRFKMYTFQNDHLAQIEIRLARMHLDQAIGRSRAIRESCSVTVYSKIPCQQTDILNPGK